MDQTFTLTQSLADRKAEVTRQCADEARRLRRRMLFGMTTSLALQSIPEPRRCDLDTTMLHTVSSTSARRVRAVASNSQPHIWKYVNDNVCIRIAPDVYALSPPHTWAQLSDHIPLDDLVMLGDAILERQRASDASSLYGFLDGMTYFRGKQHCRRALPLLSPRVMSPMETRARLAAVLHGIPAPETGYAVPNARFASGVGMTLDMAWARFRVAVEYDGDQHRTDKDQWRRDREKREWLQSHGWVVMSITASSLADDMSRAEFAFRLARHLTARGATFTFAVQAMTLEEASKRLSRNANRRDFSR